MQKKHLWRYRFAHCCQSPENHGSWYKYYNQTVAETARYFVIGYGSGNILHRSNNSVNIQGGQK